MADVCVTLPVAITSPEPPWELECSVDDVGGALREAAAQAPRFAPRLFFKDRLLVGVIVNGRHVPPRGALAHRLADGDRVEVMPPVAGG